MNPAHTILIIEDEVSLAEVLTDKLTAAGFKVLAVGDGETGLNMALSRQPDLVLLDLVLPKMDGVTMLKELRSRDEGKKIPVMVLTNLSDSENVREALQNGAYDFLVKSDWDIDDLIKNVKAKLAPVS